MAECLIMGNGGSAKTTHFLGDTVYTSVRTSEDYPKYTESFTMPRDGTVYYSGHSALLHHDPNSSNTPIYCRIYKNNTLVDSRDILRTDNWIIRGTMVGKSFSAKQGDVIKIQLQAPGCDGEACLYALCVY